MALARQGRRAQAQPRGPVGSVDGRRSVAASAAAARGHHERRAAPQTSVKRLTLRTLRGHYKFVGTCYACGSQSGIGGLTNFLVLAGMIIAWIGVNQYLCAYARHSGAVRQLFRCS
jgi:hypothetical protein